MNPQTQPVDARLREALGIVAEHLRLEFLKRRASRRWLMLGLCALLLWVVRFGSGTFAAYDLLILGIAALGIVIRGVIDANRYAIDYQAAAKAVEADHPDLKQILITAVEHCSDNTPLNFLQRSVIEQALIHPSRRSWTQTAKPAFTKQWFAQAGAMAFAGVVIVFTILNPPPRKHRNSENLALSASLTVTPGDTEIERGSSLLIAARFAGELPTGASLELKVGDAESKSITMAQSLSDPIFAYTISELKEDASYRVEYADGRSEDFRIAVFDRPDLIQADAVLDYPDYTQLADRVIEDTRRVSAVEGTRLEYRFNLNKPIRDARLRDPDGKEIKLVAANDERTQFKADFVLDQSLRYTLHLTDDANRANTRPPDIRIVSVPNKPPELKIAFPKGDQRVSPIQEVQLEAEGRDDFGLLDYGIGIATGSDEPNYHSLKEGDEKPFEAKFAYRVDLEPHGLKANDLVSWFAWADDFGPDGERRRISSDLFFAEIRPLEEIYREQESEQSPPQPGSPPGSEDEQLLEQQRNMAIAIWKLRQRGHRDAKFSTDAADLLEAQQGIRKTLESNLERIEEPDIKAHAQAALEHMEKTESSLGDARSDLSTQPLSPARSSAQGAYQALLRMMPPDYNVSRNRSQSQGSGRQRNQRQLDSLDFQEEDNRYETATQAQAATTPEQREQLKTLSKLNDLARRQGDLNERYKELQAALDAAANDEEKEKIRRELKRLEEEQRQLLADLDEARQNLDKMQASEQTEQARQELDQTRENMRKSSESLEKENVSQALASGARAQEQLDQLRDSFKQNASSQFSEQLREARQESRDLTREQRDIQQDLAELDQQTAPRLDNSAERQAIVDRMQEQKERSEELFNNLREIAEDAESTEPRLHRMLYDSLRKYDPDAVERDLDLSSRLLGQGFVEQSENLQPKLVENFERLQGDVESAAESILGNESTTLRFTQQELEDLTRQLQKENTSAQASGQPGQPGEQGQPQPGGESSQANASSPGEPNEQGSESSPGSQPGFEPGQQASSQSPGSGGQPGQSESPSDSPGEGAQGQSSQGQSAQGQGSQGQGSQGQGSQGQQAQSESNSPGGGSGGGNTGSQGGRQRGGDLAELEALLSNSGGGGGDGSLGPITGDGFSNWTERLQTLESLVEDPAARERLAQAREIAESMRREFKREDTPPQWGLIEGGIAAPLNEVRVWVRQQLARIETPDTLQPADRDPVPQAYEDSVRKYYESLGE